MHRLIIQIKFEDPDHLLLPSKTPESLEISGSYKVIIEKIAKKT